MINNPHVKAIYYTNIINDFKCDIFFPKIPLHFTKIHQSSNSHQEDITYNFQIFKNDNYFDIEDSLILDHKKALQEADKDMYKWAIKYISTKKDLKSSYKS